VHDRAAEAATARRWLDAASRHGLLQDTSWRPLLDRVCSAISERPAELAVLHRGLHDGHVILDAEQPVGLLRLDLVSYGDPAVDLASVLVHLDLRALQGICSAERAALCAAAFLEGYAPDSELAGRLAAYAGIARLRLIGVCCFRRAPAELVDRMLHAMQSGPKSWLWQSWEERH
jgi:aminoglycoside phosphotransferase (APT) family kinase protein